MAKRIIPIGENPRGGGGSATIDTIAFYTGIGGVTWLTYTLALQGSLGAEAKKIALQLYAAMHGGAAPGSKKKPVLEKEPGAPPGPKPPVQPAPPDPTDPNLFPAPGNAGWLWTRNYPGWMWNPLLPEGEGEGYSWYWGGIDNWSAQTGWTPPVSAWV